MDDPATLFTCTDPPSARRFLWRLRARQRLQLFSTLAVVALTIVILAMRDSEDSWILLHLVLGIGVVGLIVSLAIALTMRISLQKSHAFQEHSMVIYAGGIFTVYETVSAKKVKTLQISPVSFADAHFHLVLVICKHLSETYVGRMNIGGVYPVYFAVENSDVNRIVQWAQERNIDVLEGDRITSPSKLPLFIR